MPAFYLSLPLLFLKFWFIEGPVRLIKYFFAFNQVALQVLSLPLMIRTFFKPLKNEYRKGLVGFSILFGLIVKSSLIIMDLIVFAALILIEMAVLALFILLPILTVYVLFI